MTPRLRLVRYGATRIAGVWRDLYQFGRNLAGKLADATNATLMPAGNFVPSAFKLTRSAHDAGHHDGQEESEEDFNCRYVAYFDRKDIDGWELRQRMTNILGMDLIPDPTVVRAGLLACRKVNDIALAIRWVEACKDKCGDQVLTIYPYILREIRPTLNELGVPTPEELNYDKPELALKSVHDM